LFNRTKHLIRKTGGGSDLDEKRISSAKRNAATFLHKAKARVPRQAEDARVGAYERERNPMYLLSS
jgi:hypothetical protein